MVFIDVSYIHNNNKKITFDTEHLMTFMCVTSICITYTRVKVGDVCGVVAVSRAELGPVGHPIYCHGE